ncbi:hypothetical protein Fmac_001756 [Flemingia macrophylla]|uniref:Uncharacterized protein n=1 Tax=Flemingia macrophylla TaxID=520843 RepID=A0ABD1NI01_9FABA
MEGETKQIQTLTTNLPLHYTVIIFVLTEHMSGSLESWHCSANFVPQRQNKMNEPKNLQIELIHSEVKHLVRLKEVKIVFKAQFVSLGRSLLRGACFRTSRRSSPRRRTAPRLDAAPRLASTPRRGSPRRLSAAPSLAASPLHLAAVPCRLAPSRLAASSSSSRAFHPHRQNPPPSFHFNPHDADDIYAKLFGSDDSTSVSSRRGAFSSRKATPVDNALPCSLKDLYKGVKKKMKISRNVCDAFE